ncbi:MAG: AP2/ERF family transcription factor [Bacteroidota bacterium]
MVIKVKLKREEKHVLLDHEVYESLNTTPLFQEFKVFENLRQHSSGVPVFQKYLETVNGKLKIETIYLAKYIAARYLARPQSGKRLFLNFINGDKLDLRLRNLKWEEMSKLSRARTTSVNKTGFRGVRKTPQNKYVSMISDGAKQIYLGTFNTAEEAAVAYNKKSVELFGITPNLNKVNESGMVIPFELSEEIKNRVRKQSARKTTAKPVAFDQISLAPAHFEHLKKRGRKPKTLSGDSSIKEKQVPENSGNPEGGNSN